MAWWARVGNDVVVPEVEAAADPARAVQDDARHGAARRVAGLLQELGQRRDLRVHGVAEVVVDAVPVRQEPREDRDVRGKRERDVGVGPLEEDRVGAKRRERGGLDLAVAVEGEAVRAERVDGDQDDRRAGEDPEGRSSDVPARSRRGREERGSRRRKPRRRWPISSPPGV